MSEDQNQKENPTIDEFLAKMKEHGFGSEFVITVVSDYKEIDHPQLGKVSIPLTTQIEVKFNPRTSPDFKLDFFKRIDETSPIVTMSYQTGSYIKPPKSVQDMIDILQKKPCSECNDSCQGECQKEK